MTLRKLILKVHLYLGLTAALFLLLLGLTGSIMAFEGDIDYWVHPHAWYITPGDHPLSETDLITKVEQQTFPARVGIVQIAPQHTLAKAMQLSDQSVVTVNPYDGSILSRPLGPTPDGQTPPSERSRLRSPHGVVSHYRHRLVPDQRHRWAGSRRRP